MTDLGIEASSKVSYWLARFRYGDGPTDEDYTSHNVAVGTFAPVPGMEVKGVQNTGTLEDGAIEVEAPVIGGEPNVFDMISKGEIGPEVFLFLEEHFVQVGPVGASTGFITWAIGDYKLMEAFRNPGRKAGFVRLVFHSIKKRMTGLLGLPCSPMCPYTLGDKSCQATVTTELTQVVSINRKVVLTNQPTVVEGKATRYWHRGLMIFNGLPIMIRDWQNDSLEFTLVREAPASWVGQNVTLRPGCSKLPEACLDRFANLTRFGGFGRKVPSWHPNLEAP